MLPLLAFWPGTEMRSLSAGVARRRLPCAGLLTGEEILERVFAWRQWSVRYILWVVPGRARNVDDASDRPRREGSPGPPLQLKRSEKSSAAKAALVLRLLRHG